MNFDHLFRRFILTQSFVRGWGNPLHLQEIFRFRRDKIGVRDECLKLVPKESVNENTIEIVEQKCQGDRLLINGRFRAPLANHLPHLVREEDIRRNRKVICVYTDSTRSYYGSFSTRPTS